MYDPGRLLESTPTKSITTYTCATPEVLIPSSSTPLSSTTIWINSYFPPVHFHVDEDSLSCLANPTNPSGLPCQAANMQLSIPCTKQSFHCSVRSCNGSHCCRSLPKLWKKKPWLPKSNENHQACHGNSPQGLG